MEGVKRAWKGALVKLLVNKIPNVELLINKPAVRII